MHKKFLSWLTFFGLLTAFHFVAVAQTPATGAAPASDPATAPRLGDIRATRVVGNVTVTDTATNAQTALANDQIIHQGSIVRTGENSSVVLVFSNGATINLAFGSELNIEQFIQNPFEGNYTPATETEEPSVSVTSIKLTRGELVGNVKKLRANQGSRFTVGTPVGAAGIRGTTFRIVYRPTGNGQAFNFVLTTVEGNVELATGTVTLPVSVTNNQEVVINEVTVDPTTNAISVTTSTGEVVTLIAPPAATEAPVSTVQQVTNVATQLAQAIADVVIAPPSTPAPSSSATPGGGSGGDGGQGGEGGQGGANDNAGGDDSNTPQQNLPPTPGNTTEAPRNTSKAGL